MPGRRGWPWPAVLLSAALHGLLFFFVVIEGWQPALPHHPPALILLAPPASTGPVAVPMPYRMPRVAGRQGTGTAGDRLLLQLAPSPPRRVLEPPRHRAVPPAVGADTGPTPGAPPRPNYGLLRPGLGEGQLWVRPLPLPPKELAQRLSKDHVELVDSAVTAIVQAYLDSIANEPNARAQALPSWTKEIAGKKFGLDSKNIYIAGLKIPAAVLALLPISGGNIDQNAAYNHLMDLRADLEYAGQRAANLEEFKSMIKEVRLRKEREREFQQNQRTPPPPADSAAP